MKQGGSTMKLGSGAWEGPYTFASRFESGRGTNPEELIVGAKTKQAWHIILDFQTETVVYRKTAERLRVI